MSDDACSPVQVCDVDGCTSVPLAPAYVRTAFAAGGVLDMEDTHFMARTINQDHIYTPERVGEPSSPARVTGDMCVCVCAQLAWQSPLPGG